MRPWTLPTVVSTCRVDMADVRQRRDELVARIQKPARAELRGGNMMERRLVDLRRLLLEVLFLGKGKHLFDSDHYNTKTTWSLRTYLVPHP